MHQHICFASMCCLSCSCSLSFASQLCTAYLCHSNKLKHIQWICMIKFYQALQGVIRSTPSKASIRTTCIAHRLQAVSPNHIWKSRFCYHLYYWRITHTQKPYSELVLCANGSRFRGCHPFHFLLSVLSQPLRLAQTLVSLPIFQDKRMSLQWDFV